MTVQATAGQPVTLLADFYVGGSLADPAAAQLDLTYGSAVGLVPDYAGPFTYSGASSPVAGQVYRVSTGQYAFQWQVPASAETGAYVANWTFTDSSGDEWPGSENIWVQGASPVPVPGGDTGYWTGGIVNALAGLDIEFGQVDSNGTVWLWQSVTGWDSPPVQGGGVTPRAGDHGAWASPQYYAARQITLTCTASAETQALRDVARAQLQQAVPVGADGNLAVLRYDEPVSKQCLVRRSGQVTEKCPTLLDVTFTVGLVAPDPRKYASAGKTVTITPMPSGGGGDLVVPFTVPFSLAAAPPPGSTTAVNAGNFGSPPVAVISGPVTGPALTNLTTGMTVSWPTLTLGAGDVLLADFLNRQAWVNPSSITATPGTSGGSGTYWPAGISSAWWDLQPGASAVQLGGVTGSGCTATLFFADAYT